MRYILSILTMTVVFITLWVKPASAYLELDETAVQLGDCYANGSGGGKGGYIDIRTGVLVDTGPGYEPGSAKTPVDLTESRLLGEPGEHRKYYYRQVVGGPTLTIRGNVTIYCQFRFSAILVGDFTYGVPSVTIYAGHALEIDPSSPWSFPYGYDPPLGHQEAYPGFHALSFRHMTPQEGQESDGGRVTFHTTQHGNIDILFMYANGVAGGDIVLMANQGSISVIGEGPVTASGWGGGQGGTIALRAESISGHFYARDNDGEVNVAVDDDSRLETWADNVTQGSYISNPEAEPELVDKDNWTIIVYSAADDATHVEYYWQNLRIRMRRNSIEDDLERDLNSMENYSLSSKPVNLLVQMDRHPDNPLQ